MTYRYPGELRTLAVTLTLVAFAVLFATPLSMGGVLLLVGVGLAVRMARIWWRVQTLRSTSTPVSDHPELAALVERCRQRLGMTEKVDVFVQDKPVLNAFAIGLSEPYAVVIYTGLVRALDEDELSSVIGHELGHIQARHTLLLGLVGQAGSQTFGAGLLGLVLRRAVFLLWMRQSEYTADRAGLLACGSLDKALTTELKLNLGRRWAEVDLQGLVARYRDRDAGLSDHLRALASTHPGMYERIDQLVDFYHSKAYAEARRQAG